MSDFSRYEANRFLNHADIIDWNKLIGHRITAYDDREDNPVKVEVETIVRNVMKPWKMEINGKFLVSVFELAFHMTGEKIDKETIRAYDRHFASAEVTPMSASPLVLPGNRAERRRLFSMFNRKK